MRVLITGGSGFIGRNLIRHLQGKAEIVFLGRSLPEDLSNKITEYVHWDILSGNPPRKKCVRGHPDSSGPGYRSVKRTVFPNTGSGILNL